MAQRNVNDKPIDDIQAPQGFNDKNKQRLDDVDPKLTSQPFGGDIQSKEDFLHGDQSSLKQTGQNLSSESNVDDSNKNSGDSSQDYARSNIVNDDMSNGKNINDLQTK